ncbi:MAG TPA: Mov34/MPN/PAD-1 family protein, partial [Solirubrobacterales bacterium]|nr:Mov34/MPN/PAD-1 family protein [Solirubrobacterales bacterium]
AGRRFRETGGALFGYEAASDLLIAQANGPGPRAKHRRTRYVPHPDDVQAEIDEIFAASEGTFRYLGDWHSHPGGRAYPSSVDKKSAEQIATNSETALPEPVVLIQATAPLKVHVSITKLAAYRWSLKEKRLLPVDLVTQTIVER